MNKLPRVTLLFWIMKIAATTLGETAGDLLSMTLKVGYAVSSMMLVGLLLVTLVTQLRSKQYHPWLYWTVILLTSTAGTTMSDCMDRTLEHLTKWRCWRLEALGWRPDIALSLEPSALSKSAQRSC